MENTYTKKEASRIAFFGARKMTAEGYTCKRIGAFPPLFEVRNPEGRAYSVRPAYTTRLGKAVAGSCSCAFFTTGSHGQCKHLTWVGWEMKAEAEEEARIQEDAEAGQDYMDFIETRKDDAVSREMANN